MMTKDRDALFSENDELIRELQLYKSVAVPTDFKPRSTMTRVSRVPLGSHSLNTGLATRARNTDRMPVSVAQVVDEMEYREGDMTIDEIL